MGSQGNVRCLEAREMPHHHYSMMQDDTVIASWSRLTKGQPVHSHQISAHPIWVKSINNILARPLKAVALSEWCHWLYNETHQDNGEIRQVVYRNGWYSCTNRPISSDLRHLRRRLAHRPYLCVVIYNTSYLCIRYRSDTFIISPVGSVMKDEFLWKCQYCKHACQN